MRSRALAFACTALLCGSLARAETPWPLANDALVHSARLWEARDRGDLARLALEKLVAARPDLPEALLALGELHLRMADPQAAAQVLHTLQTRFPDSEAARTLALEYRLATRDRLQLASIQRLLQMNRGAEARKELDRVFGAPPTQGTIAIEYYRLLAGTPGGWQPARVGMERLVARYPDDPRYRLALAQLLLRRSETEQQGLREMQALWSRDDVRKREIDDALASALSSVGYANTPADILRGHLSRHPDDAAARAALTRRAFAQEEAALLASHRLRTVRPELQQQNLQAAEQALPEGDGHARALLDALRGRPVTEPVDEVLASVQWRQRAQTSLAAGHEALAALQLQAALLFARKDYEAAIPLAEALEPLQAAEAGALLATASRLAPRSDWLFATHMRWLIAHERADEAIPLLEARAPGEERDELLASALDERARTAIAAGRLQAAESDLQRAMRLQPRNVWVRYRLAGSYAQSGEPQRGVALLQEIVAAEPANEEASYAYALYLASIDDGDGALAAIAALPAQARTARVQELEQRLVREQRLARVRKLRRERQFDAAAALLDELLAQDASDRSLRVARADLDLEAGHTRAALDRYAALVAEDPADVDTRLSYVRALTQARELDLARLQLQSARERIAPDDADGQLTLARRYWALDDTDSAMNSVQAVLRVRPNDAQALLLAGYIEQSLGHYTAANDYFQRAESAVEADVVEAARTARADFDVRLASWMTGGIEMRHKPGDGGISRFDSVTLPTLWQLARDYDRRLWIHADAVTLDAGRLSDDYDDAALLGTIQAAGPAALRRHDNERESGLSVGVGYTTDRWSVDLGTTPLGFLLPQIVGGVEWTPRLGALDVALGASRRALTSSVLSYAGLRDPITGEKWGGVVDTGLYAQAGSYREWFSVSGSLRVSRLTGDDVPDNDFIGARVAADRKVIAWPNDRAYVGVAVTYWNYERDLSNYTFGSGGYYSPHSYVSVALPVEWQGRRGEWSYRIRASISHSSSRTKRTPFYFDDALQTAAATSPLPSGYDEPFFDGDRSNGASLSGYAAVERSIAPALVLGAKLDIDRADYYEPTVFMLYARHVFGGRRTEIAMPPRPVRPYSEQR